MNKNMNTNVANNGNNEILEKKEDRTMAEVKNNQTVANNNNNDFLEKKEGTGMKYNRLKATRVAEQEAKQAAVEAQAETDRQAAIQAEIDAVEPIDLVQTMDEVTGNVARTYRNEEGCSYGTNGGKYYQKPVIGADGQPTTIAADSLEEIERIEEAIKNGLAGDGKYHKMLTIGGLQCECVGATPEELEADIVAAKKYAQAHSEGSILRDIDVAEQLVDAEYNKKDLEEYKSEANNDRYLICYDGNYIMDLDGNTQVTLEDLTSKLSREDVKKLLIERLENVIKEELEAEAEEEEYEDEYYDCYNEDEDCEEDEDY